MSQKAILATILLIFILTPTLAQEAFVFGMILVGDPNDQGWSEAHRRGGEYLLEHIDGAQMLLFEGLNPTDHPNVSFIDVVDEMVAGGARLIFSTAMEFEEATLTAARTYPDVAFIHISGSAALGDIEDMSPTTTDVPPNFVNLMGQMEYGKMIAGCAAALATESGKIRYLGPLINAETHRYVSSAYLGARYCYDNFRGEGTTPLDFGVSWIGFWFHIPDITLDPVELIDEFFDDGADVVLSGIDTPEALLVAGERAEQGQVVFAESYNSPDGCPLAEDACLGTPYFNWGPAYLNLAESVLAGTFESTWWWSSPDWGDLNNPDTTAVGWLNGTALNEDIQDQLAQFIAEMAAFATNPENQDRLFLWEGPLRLQDGTTLAEEGAFVDVTSIWYLPLLLEGIGGDSLTTETSAENQ